MTPPVRSGMLHPMSGWPLTCLQPGALAVLAGLLAACGEDAKHCPAPDPAELSEARTPRLVAALSPAVDGLPGPLWRDPETGVILEDPTADALIDPSPLLRGEHPMWALGRGPDCELTLIERPGVLPLHAPRTTPFGPALPDQRFGAIVLTTDAADLRRGPTDEWNAWPAVFERLGVSGLALSGFTGLEADNAVEAALEARLADIVPGGVFILVTSGPASATGPGLVYGRSGRTPLVMGFGRLSAVLGRAGAHLGLLVWIADHGLAHEVRLPLGVPSLLIRGSDRFAPNAPRIGPGGPSAMPLGFMRALTGVLAERCLSSEVTDPGELAAILKASAERLRPALLALRWERLGAPALSALLAAGRLTPQRRDLVARTLEGQLATEILADNLRGNPLPAESVCESDLECRSRDACLGPCGQHRCDAGRCVVAATPERACDDGLDCTSDDQCDTLGQCRGTPVVCDDGDPCTDEACEPDKGCVANPAPGRACDDGDGCTLGDACDEAGVCIGSTKTCDDGDPCTVDTCDPVAGCRNEPGDGLACDDGDACTLADRCQAGLCLGVARPCGDDNPCTADRCDPATGACVFAPLADLVSCVDEDPCTNATRCIAGRCEGLTRTCDDGVACTLDQCGPDGLCRNLPAPGTCLSPVPGEGCIPVGARPASDPCSICVATGVLSAEADGASCGPGEGCGARRCLSGRCVVRDDESSCSTPDGGCVGVGEPLAECLTCLGGGIAEAQTGTSCGGPPECGIGTCQAGLCQTGGGPRPCCPPKRLTCGQSWELGVADFAGLGSRVDVWSGGLSPTAAPGPERWLEVEVPCDGTLGISVLPLESPDPTSPESEGSARLVLDAAACIPGLVSAGSGNTPPWPSGPVGTAFPTLQTDAFEVVRFALEVTGSGRWLVTTACECAPAP